MDKKVLNGLVESIVNRVVVAHGGKIEDKNDQTAGRSMTFLALKKNVDAIVAATNPEPVATDEDAGLSSEE